MCNNNFSLHNSSAVPRPDSSYACLSCKLLKAYLCLYGTKTRSSKQVSLLLASAAISDPKFRLWSWCFRKKSIHLSKTPLLADQSGNRMENQPQFVWAGSFPWQKPASFQAASIDKAVLMFSPVLQISSSWECMKRYAWYAAQLQSILPITLWSTAQKAFPKCYHMAWDTQTTKLGSEERFRRIFPLWWHRKSLNSIYSRVSARWKKGLQHSPQGLVLLFSVLQEGGLQSLACGSLANLILSRTLCCKYAIYCQAGPKSAQTWGGVIEYLSQHI